MKRIVCLMLTLALMLGTGALAMRDYRAEITQRGLDCYTTPRSGDVLPLLVADGMYILDFPDEKNVFVYINCKDDPNYSYITILENTVVEEGGVVLEMARALAFNGELSDVDTCVYVGMENGTSMMDWNFHIYNIGAESGNGGEGAENIYYYDDPETFISAVLENK